MADKYQKWLHEETTLPKLRNTIDTLLQSLIKPESLKRDLFFALLLVLMNENDFLLMKESDGSTISIVDYISLMYKEYGENITAFFILKGFESLPFKLIQAPVGDIILINAVVLYPKQRTYSICFPINRYVVTAPTGLPHNFVNVDTLCLLFRERIIEPVKNTILNNRPGGSLAGLPTEILYKILLILPVRDILNVSVSCKRINEIVNEDCLWFHLYDRDFADNHKRQAIVTTDHYKDMYKKKFLKVKLENVGRIFHVNNVTNIEIDGYLMYSCVPDPRLEVIL